MEYESEIIELTSYVWDSILHLPIEIEKRALPTGQQTMSACVHITGAWPGAVSLICGTELAARAANIMFDLGDKPASTSDMQDAIGELTNMIGGNVKALLPETCQLSLPAVVQGTDYSVRIPGSTVLTHIPMRCGDYKLSVSLLQKKAA